MRSARNRRGAAAAEFALVSPLFFLLVLATIDLVQLIRTQLRLDAAATQLGQIVSQCNRITDPGDTSQFWTHAQRILGGVGRVTGGSAPGAVIVSAVFSEEGANRVAWQRRTGDAGRPSSVGRQGGAATLAGGFVVPAGQTLIVTEIYAPRQAWVLSAGLMGDLLPRMLNGTTLFLSRAPDASALQQPPEAEAEADCTA